MGLRVSSCPEPVGEEHDSPSKRRTLAHRIVDILINQGMIYQTGILTHL